MKFSELNLSDQLLEALSYMSFEKATPIQEQAIPKILEGRDILACAQTGTGKTAAFILPILDKLSRNNPGTTDTLVICPTRELAIQIEQQIQGFSYFLGVNSIAVYGGGDGVDFAQQQKALEGGTEIIVATPGKLLSHLSMGNAKFKNIKHLILDEADRMLDMGFNEDIQKIMGYLPEKRQYLMFSATFPPKMRDLAATNMVNPHEIKIAISKPSEAISQGAYLTYDEQKIPVIAQILDAKPEFKSIIVFSSTIRNVSKIVAALKKKGLDVAGISSELNQSERESVLMKFKAKRIRIIVATDILSRGIDIKDINLVVNYDVPNDGEDYVHRIGRTARADTKGMALTLINEDDMYKFLQIERLIEKEVRKLSLPAGIGEGPKWNTNPSRKKKGGFKKKRR